MTTRVTITKAGRRDSYGIELSVGQTVTVDDQFALDLVRQGFATDTDDVMGFNPSSFVNHSYSLNSPKPNQPLSEELSGMARIIDNSLVDGAGNQVYATPSALWATRATLAAAGVTSVFFTDVGVGGSYWFYAGGRWRPVGGSVTLKNLITPVSNATTTKTVLDYATFLPGLIQDGDTVLTNFLKERTGGTSDTDATDMGIGTNPTVFGNTLGISTSTMGTTNITFNAPWGFRRESATSVRRTNSVAANGVGTGTGNNNAVTVADMDANTTYLQMSSQLTTGAGEVSWLRVFQVVLTAGA